MILSKKVLLKEIRDKKIKITPYNRRNIGGASIDITLDDKFRIFKSEKVKLTENSDYKKYSKLVRRKEILVMPGQFVLGITKEKIKLPNNICGWIYGRTRYARFGLSVHSTASFIQPGVNNKQVFEISNKSNMPLILKAGTKIGQIIFERIDGEGKDNGRYNNQKSL
jgi:dCTP deaminase